MAWYNEIFLPDLPEYDTAAYPYACIQWIPYRKSGFVAHLRFSNRPFRAADGIVSNTPGSIVLVQTYFSTAAALTWGKAYALPNPSLALKGNTVLWCNANILDQTGSTFLAASEPVPTSAGILPDFRLSSWLTGVVLGLANHP